MFNAEEMKKLALKKEAQETEILEVLFETVKSKIEEDATDGAFNTWISKETFYTTNFADSFNGKVNTLSDELKKLGFDCSIHQDNYGKSLFVSWQN